MMVEPVASSLRRLFGSVKPKKKPENLRKVRDAVEKSVANDAARSK